MRDPEGNEVGWFWLATGARFSLPFVAVRRLSERGEFISINDVALDERTASATDALKAPTSESA
jgi:hypothetical protein